jgi:hypothetical protein
MFIVLYTVNLHFCVFMTCSKSYCLYDTLMDPWNLCMHVCIYVHFLKFYLILFIYLFFFY